MEHPLVSVIVPVYNAERTIVRCLDSLLSQTYDNFEVILINDGSVDASKHILDSYANTNNDSVRIYHKENGGVCSARNLGLDVAKGDFITFVDSDDWVEANYIEDFLPDIPVDFVANYYVAEGWAEWVSCPFANKEYDSEHICDFFSSEFNHMNLCWSKLFRKSIIDEHHIRFDNSISYGEDTLFVYSFLSYVNNVRIKGNPVYHYDCQNVGSLSLAPTPWYKYDHAINALCNVIKRIEQKYSWNGYHAINIVVKNNFNRFFREIQADYPIILGIKGLKLSMQNKYVVQQVMDNTTYQKSKSRRIFDWLLLHKMYISSVILMKLSYKDKKRWFRHK